MQIYKITRIDTGRVYVGLSDDPPTRWRKHRNEARRTPVPKTELMRNMQDFDPERFKFEIIEDVTTYEQARERERHWIAKFKEAAPGVYNMHTGGAGTVSYEARAKMSIAQQGIRRGPMSEEHRAKIAAATRGKVRSPETREKIAAAHRGKLLSEEHRAKLSKVRRGMKRSPEARARMSAAAKARWARIGSERQ